MLKPIHWREPAFARVLESLELRRADGLVDVDKSAADIIADVRARGDRALIDFTDRFDGYRLTTSNMQVTAAQMKAALKSFSKQDREALELAARRIREFHSRNLDESFEYRDKLGIRLGQIIRPLQRVGIYVPGGAAAYPSTVLMNAIAAQVAGVTEIVMVSPIKPGEGRAVLAAAAVAGLDEVFRVGGAQAIAALAYGTDTIRPVDKIVGPGNAYVQAAKRLVYGVVDIDKIAGPSEVLVIADESAKPEWVAADLIAQAEHGSGDESAVLLTPSMRIANEVSEAVAEALEDLPRADAVKVVLERRGAIGVVRDLAHAFEIANRIAPEHLELDIERPEKWLPSVKSAGAVFLGAMSPAPLGDYIAGPNHVLPTGGSARFASPLGAYDFLKRTSIIQANESSVRKLAPAVARLARMEGFEAHARAVEVRLVKKGKAKRNGRKAKN